MKTRVRAKIAGRVQGVGFRYSAQRTATSLDITGWVKNLDDGRVEVVCEGKDADLKAFQQKIEAILGQYIRDRDVEWSSATNEFDYFDIRF